MKFADYIRNIFGRKDRATIVDRSLAYGWGDFGVSREPYADVIFYNICDLLTDICSAVTFTNQSGYNMELFAGFKIFFDEYGKYVLNALFKHGYVAIGRRRLSTGLDTRLWVMGRNEYTTNTTSDSRLIVLPNDPNVEVYVMSSQTMMLEGKSDKEMLRPFLRLLDNVLNGANTISERLGSTIIMSPQQASGMPMPTILTKAEKEEMEKELGDKYGYLRNQRSVMILPSPMNVQTINLAGLDNRMIEKVKTAILAICDRIKVPANQVGIIDANSNRAFANGSELREGDIIKYRNFRRLLNQTFFRMAEDLGLQVDYLIENEPKSDADSVSLMNAIKKQLKQNNNG